jgi:hypothetical protein
MTMNWPQAPNPAIRVAGRFRSTSARPSRWFLSELERPGDVFRNLGPNWFTSVMGTGIVATAAALLPV